MGAEPRTVTTMIVRRGMRYALGGSVVGLGVALVEARWLESFLFGVPPRDLTTLVLVAGVLLTIAALACWLPGLRAARIHPVEAIATE